MSKVLHNIIMTSTENPDVCIAYSNVESCERIHGCILVLHLEGQKALRFDADKWQMYDLTPTMGWNCAAVKLPAETNQAAQMVEGDLKAKPLEQPGQVQIAVSFVRERVQTEQVWDDILYVILPRGACEAGNVRSWLDSEFILGHMRAAASTWLQAPHGWNANINAGPGLTWDGFVKNLPASSAMYYSSTGIGFQCARKQDIPVIGTVSIHVDQDEQLAEHVR